MEIKVAVCDDDIKDLANTMKIKYIYLIMRDAFSGGIDQ